jgi:ubiquinone/menaquinone biosynthesis C-methylase UbiE
MTKRNKYQKPNPYDFYQGKVAKSYEDERRNKKTWQKENQIVEYYLDKIVDIDNVLDIPFGTGRFVPLYIRKNLEIHGVEISGDMINTSREILKDDFLKCNVIIGNSVSLPYKDDYFDILICTRFLTAILTFGDVNLSLKEFSRVTKKYFLLEIGHREDKAPRLRTPSEDEKMGYWFYPDEIQEMLKEKNIEPIDCKSVLQDLYIYLCRKI